MFGNIFEIRNLDERKLVECVFFFVLLSMTNCYDIKSNFTQLIGRRKVGSSMDCSSQNCLVASSSALTTPRNLDRSVSAQTLPSPKKKHSDIPKRSITFASLPPSSKNKSIEDNDHTPSTVMVKSLEQIKPVHVKFTSHPLLNTNLSRFQLPPTPMTNPNSTTSIPFYKRQIARSVDGRYPMVEVGLKSA